MEKLTPKARLDFLVEMALEAWDRLAKFDAHTDEARARRREAFKAQATERMAQASQVWTIEADEA